MKVKAVAFVLLMICGLTVKSDDDGLVLVAPKVVTLPVVHLPWGQGCALTYGPESSCGLEVAIDSLEWPPTDVSCYGRLLGDQSARDGDTCGEFKFFREGRFRPLRFAESGFRSMGCSWMTCGFTGICTINYSPLFGWTCSEGNRVEHFFMSCSLDESDPVECEPIVDEVSEIPN